MKKMLFLAGFLCVFLSGCHKRSTSSGRMGESLYTIQEMPHKLFSLDDSTTQVLSYILVQRAFRRYLHIRCGDGQGYRQDTPA